MSLSISIENDINFEKAVVLFNNHQWYLAHDAFEDIWHRTIGKERVTIQAILQIAVAQVHLDNGNILGATILYGEGLGRLKTNNLPNLGLDLVLFSNIVEKRLSRLQHGKTLIDLNKPELLKLG